MNVWQARMPGTPRSSEHVERPGHQTFLNGWAAGVLNHVPQAGRRGICNFEVNCTTDLSFAVSKTCTQGERPAIRIVLAACPAAKNLEFVQRVGRATRNADNF